MWGGCFSHATVSATTATWTLKLIKEDIYMCMWISEMCLKILPSHSSWLWICLNRHSSAKGSCKENGIPWYFTVRTLPKSNHFRISISPVSILEFSRFEMVRLGRGKSEWVGACNKEPLCCMYFYPKTQVTYSTSDFQEVCCCCPCCRPVFVEVERIRKKRRKHSWAWVSVSVRASWKSFQLLKCFP